MFLILYIHHEKQTDCEERSDLIFTQYLIYKVN